jgi:hypothetical protein
MWVLTEDGKLANLAKVNQVRLSYDNWVCAFPEPQICLALCSCENREHGEQIIVRLAECLVLPFGMRTIRMADIKRDVEMMPRKEGEA